MSKVTINGVDLELDLMDADVVEKFEDLNKWIEERSRILMRMKA
ncbi:MAG: hypothetical protein ACLU00_08470 [Mediterraneibacter faecis]